MVLDVDTWITVQAIIKRSHDLGLDVAEQLDRKGLILSPAAEQRIRADTIQFILSELQSWRPSEMLRTKFHPEHSASPANMMEAIECWLQGHLETTRNTT